MPRDTPPRRFYCYALKGNRLRTFYATAGGELAGQVSFLRRRGWKVFWRPASA